MVSTRVSSPWARLSFTCCIRLAFSIPILRNLFKVARDAFFTLMYSTCAIAIRFLYFLVAKIGAFGEMAKYL